ncbi:lysostaphin resistance A-like protein [Neisseriaceae bacterium B1]
MQQLIANIFKFIALIVLYIIPSTLILLWHESMKRGIELGMGATSLLYAFTFGVFILVLWTLQTVYRKGQPENSPIAAFQWIAPIQVNLILKSIPYLLAMLSLGWAFDFFMSWFSGSEIEHTTTNQALIVQMIELLPPAIMVFNIVIFAPIGEELLFRGIFSNYFAAPYTRFRLIASWLISSALFAAMHLSSVSLPEFALYFTMGLLLGGVYWHTKDLRYAISVHMINNAIGAAGLYLGLT